MFIFGTIYFGNVQEGANLLLLENGLYADDWSAFGAFIAAPVGGLLWGIGACALRLGCQWASAKIKGYRFDALDKPAYLLRGHVDGVNEYADRSEVDVDSSDDIVRVEHTGKFF